MGEGILLGIVFVVIAAGFFLHSEWSQNRTAKTERAEVFSTASERALETYAAPDGKSAIAICKNGKDIRLVDQEPSGLHRVRIVQGADIIEAAVVVDDQPIVVSRKEGSLARAAVGGALFGGVGAIAGAATAGSSSTTIVRAEKLTLRLLLNDASEPQFEVGFLHRNGAYRHSAEYKQAEIAANRWLARLKVLMHQAAS